MRKYLTDLKTQRIEANNKAVNKTIVRPGSSKIRRRSPGKVSG